MQNHAMPPIGMQQNAKLSHPLFSKINANSGTCQVEKVQREPPNECFCVCCEPHASQRPAGSNTHYLCVIIPPSDRTLHSLCPPACLYLSAPCARVIRVEGSFVRCRATVPTCIYMRPPVQHLALSFPGGCVVDVQINLSRQQLLVLDGGGRLVRLGVGEVGGRRLGRSLGWVPPRWGVLCQLPCPHSANSQTPNKGIISPSHDIIFPFTQSLNGTLYGFLSHLSSPSLLVFLSVAFPTPPVPPVSPPLVLFHNSCSTLLSL